MTKLVERIIVEIELDGEPSALERNPRSQLREIWPSLGSILDARGKWGVSGPGFQCWLTNLGLEEVPEEGGGDN